MRVPFLVLSLATLLALAPAAKADEPAPPAPCWPATTMAPTDPLHAEFARLDPRPVTEAALGTAQLGEVRLGPEPSTWSIGWAPGVTDIAAARASLEQRLRAAYAPADAEMLIAALRMVPQPYAYAYLRGIASDIAYKLQGSGFTAFAVDISCRVTVTLYAPNGPAQLEQARQRLANYGDRVWVELSASPAPAALPGIVTTPAPATTPATTPGPAPSTRPAAPRLKIASALRAPSAKRCVTGRTVTLRPRGGAKLTVTVAGKARTSRKPVRITLRGKRTTVRVTATARDGRTATQRLTYRRCAGKR